MIDAAKEELLPLTVPDKLLTTVAAELLLVVTVPLSVVIVEFRDDESL